MRLPKDVRTANHLRTVNYPIDRTQINQHQMISRSCPVRLLTDDTLSEDLVDYVDTLYSKGATIRFQDGTAVYITHQHEVKA